MKGEGISAPQFSTVPQSSGGGITVLVCGGRNYDDARRVFATLDRVDVERGIIKVINGGALGADALGMRWAARCQRAYESFPAEWQKHGRAAGPIRNQRMIDEGNPSLVIAFPGGRGTADMVRRARAAGIEVVEVA